MYIGKFVCQVKYEDYEIFNIKTSSWRLSINGRGLYFSFKNNSFKKYLVKHVIPLQVKIRYCVLYIYKIRVKITYIFQIYNRSKNPINL